MRRVGPAISESASCATGAQAKVAGQRANFLVAA